MYAYQVCFFAKAEEAAIACTKDLILHTLNKLEKMLK